MKEIVIAAAGRTAIGTAGGVLANVPASTLGTTVIKGLLERSNLKPQDIDEFGDFIFGRCFAEIIGAEEIDFNCFFRI